MNLTPWDKYEMSYQAARIIWKGEKLPADVQAYLNSLYIAYLNSEPELLAQVTKIGETE